MYGISKIARENGFKVLLVGEGGGRDRGYPIYTTLSRLNILNKFFSNEFLEFLLKIPFPNLF